MMILFHYMMILFLLYDDTSSLYDDNFALYDDTQCENTGTHCISLQYVCTYKNNTPLRYAKRVDTIRPFLAPL
jgi:hypothetical protein